MSRKRVNSGKAAVLEENNEFNERGKIDSDIEVLEKRTDWMEKKSSKIVLISMFTALSVVIGYMLALIPNIEIFTLMIFLSGFVLGRKYGLIVGFFSSLIFTLFNPLGPSPIPLLTVQLIYYSIVGFLGGFAKNFMLKKDYFKPKQDLYVFKILVIFALFGAVMTFSFDLISTFVDSIFYGIPFIPYYLSGIIFTTLHLVGNTLGFIFILPALIQLTYKLLY